MCGLGGMVVWRDGAAPPARDALLRMASALRHRGPDEFGLYRSQRAGLAHARLSLVDLHTGQQPMADASGQRWVAFNGEIYNHIELRQTLQALGHPFRTSSDTEVILAAWRQWGPSAFERLNGQWAVALWDENLGQLVLARDPMGICPLHWCEHQGRLLFASEVKALFAADPTLPRALDPLGMVQTLTFWCTVAPRTVFQGVHELPPGTVRVFREGRVVDHTVQPLTYNLGATDPARFSGNVADAAHEVLHALRRATALRVTRADVPVGSYLSGGLDSSLIAALGQEVAGAQFQTFSLRFEDAEYDESGFQRLMVDRLGSQHHEVTVSRHDIARCFPDVVFHTERPLLRTAPAPLYLLSGLVHAHGIKAVLTGEGADEMFAGYDLFREGKVRRFWGSQPQSLWRPALLERLYPYLARSPVAQKALSRQFFGRNLAHHREPGFAHGPRWQTTAALQRLLHPDFRAAAATQDDPVQHLLTSVPAAFAQWDTLSQDQYLEIRTLLHGYLLASQGDRVLLGQSVEGRYPFLDKDVVALGNHLPARHKLQGLDEKHVLKLAAAGLVPGDIVHRRKQPYRAPDALCFVAPDAPAYVNEMLSETSVAHAQVFDPRLVTQLLRKCQANAHAQPLSNTDNMALVAVLSTQLLHAQFIQTCPTGSTSLALVTDVDRTRLTETPP